MLDVIASDLLKDQYAIFFREQYFLHVDLQNRPDFYLCGHNVLLAGTALPQEML
jgi:hypothetical protein